MPCTARPPVREFACSGEHMILVPRSSKRRLLQRPQFEAVMRFAPEDKNLVKRVLDSLILSNEAKRWSSASLVLTAICRTGQTQKTPRGQCPRGLVRFLMLLRPAGFQLQLRNCGPGPLWAWRAGRSAGA
jgi:hypothetical protein